MNIFMISSNNIYQSINVDSVIEIGNIANLSLRKSYIKEWVPFKIKIDKKNGRKKLLPEPDCLGLIKGSVILNKKAIEILKDILEPTGEFLQLEYNGKNDYFIYNCLNFIDVIDKSKDSIEEIGHNILFYNKCDFILNKVENEFIFREIGILEFASSLFVTDKFVNKVLESGLKGFRFCHMWSSEGGLRYPRYIET